VFGALAVAVILSAVVPSIVHRATARSAPAAKAIATRSPRPGVADRVAGAADFEPPTESSLVVHQPDGATFQARLTPAQLGGSLEVDGYSVERGTDGWWRYSSTDARVGVEHRPADLAPGVSRVDLGPDATQRSARLQVLEQLRSASLQAQQMAAVAGGPRVFRFPVLMLATWWDSDAGQTSPQFQPGSNTPEYFKAILDGFGGNPHGTLTEFYFENSYGQFLVQVDVFGPFTSVRSVQDRCYYGGIDPPPSPIDDLDPTDTVLGVGGLGAVGMAIEAVPQADAAGVDFSVYDNNNDGYVDFMGIVHSGADMAVTGDPCNTWSHALPVSTFGDVAESTLGLPTDTIRGGLPTDDGVLVDRVFTMPEFDEKGGGLQIGVASHEMAHALGEPDYYAVNDTSSGDGDWDIMSGGSYLGNPGGSNPSWFNPATRVFQKWATPTIVHGDLENYVLQPRETPIPGYTVADANPALLLVPNRWIKVGETDDTGHKWSEHDVYGLAPDGDNGFVIDGWYLEYASRTAGPNDPLHGGMTRSPYFDRGLHGSGLLTWHFDYWRRSNTFFGGNDAQDDPDRMQMDVEEWDYYDDTQDIALNFHRGEASDPVHGTATGITSGTHQTNPSQPPAGGTAQSSTDISGTTTPVKPSDAPFVVDDNPANYTMRVRAGGAGDCKLQLLRKVGNEEIPETAVIDSGSAGAQEEAIVTQPTPGNWIARVSDFAACLMWTGTVQFEAPGFDAQGSADTWHVSTVTDGNGATVPQGSPTGWAFTNIRGGAVSGLDMGAETVGPNQLTLDVLQLADAADVSPGYAFPAANTAHGLGVATAGEDNAFSVPVFSNGGHDPGPVHVVVRKESATGPIVAEGDVTPGAYNRTPFDFTFDPGAEGPYTLVTQVDPGDDIAEGSEANNVQVTTGWAGPANPSVLVVDDEGFTDGEDAYTGALAALGVPYAVATHHVEAETMQAYDAVIWVGSIDRGPGQLDESDRAAITDYLNGGGRLWLASNRALGAVEVDGAPEFAAGYFGATAFDTTTLEHPHTVKGTGDIFGTGEFELQPYPIRPFSDLVKPVDEGVFGTVTQVLELEHANKPGKDGAGFGTKVDGNSDHGSFRTVLTPFSLSQASTADTAIGLTRSVLEYFGVATGQYTPESTDPLVFHTDVRFSTSGHDTPVTAIVVGGDSGAPVTLFYRIHGTDEFTALPMTAGSEAGSFDAIIPGAAVTPSGLDYFIKAGSHSTFDPAPARDGSVYHAIAVAIPEIAAAPVAPTPALPDTPAAVDNGPLPRTGWSAPLALVALGMVMVLAARALRRQAETRP
jgi:M6 family metalloprotease-like protein